jgi:hypothetical protein
MQQVTHGLKAPGLLSTRPNLTCENPVSKFAFKMQRVPLHNGLVSGSYFAFAGSFYLGGAAQVEFS